MNFHEQSFDRHVDSTMREIIVLLLQQNIRLTPELIERIRWLVIGAMNESGKLAVSRDNDRRRKHTIIPGPWDDEPTEPERPSNKPPRIPNGER